MPLHLDALGRRVRGHRPVGGSAPVEAQRSDLTWVKVAQLPGGPVHLFGLEVGPLIPKLAAVAEQPLGLFVLRLRLHLEGLAVLCGEAVLRLLDVLIQRFAQLSAQLPIRQTALAASFWTRPFLLGLAAALAAGAGLWRAAVRLVAVSNRRLDEGIQKVALGVFIVAFFFGVAEASFLLQSTPEVSFPSSFVLFLVRTVDLLFSLDLVQKFGIIRIVRPLLQRQNATVIARIALFGCKQMKSITFETTQTFFLTPTSSSSSSSSNSFLFFLSLSSGLGRGRLQGDSRGGCRFRGSSGLYLGVSSRSGLLLAAEETSPSSFTGFCSLSREPGRLEAYLNPGPLFCFNTKGDKKCKTTLYLQLILTRQTKRTSSTQKV